MFYRGAFKGTLSKREFCKTSDGNEVAGPTTLGPDTSSRAVPPSWCGVGREGAVIRGGGLRVLPVPLNRPPPPRGRLSALPGAAPAPPAEAAPGSGAWRGHWRGHCHTAALAAGAPCGPGLRTRAARASASVVGARGRRSPWGYGAAPGGPAAAPRPGRRGRGAPRERGTPGSGRPAGGSGKGAQGAGRWSLPSTWSPSSPAASAVYSWASLRLQLVLSPHQPRAPAAPRRRGVSPPVPGGPGLSCALRLRGVEAACRPGRPAEGYAYARALCPEHSLLTEKHPKHPARGAGNCLFVCLFVHLSRSLAGGKASVSHPGREAAPRPPQRASAWLGCGGAWEAFQKRRERQAGGQRLPQGQTRPFRTGR